MAGWCWGETREGQAISRAGAAALFITLTFLSSVAVAHAAPSLDLANPSARAGDPVNFTISDVYDTVTYDLYVDGNWVTDDTVDASDDGVVSGIFTMPDLGSEARTVSVEVAVSGRRRKAQSDLDYLGPALPGTAPPAQAPPSAGSVQPQAATSPRPPSSPKVVGGASPEPATPGPSHRRTRGSGKKPGRPTRPADDRNGGRHRARRRHERQAASRHRRSNHNSHRGRAISGGSGPPGLGPQEKPPLKPAAPHRVVLAATGARPAGGTHASVVVPAVLGLSSLALAGTAVLRRRRLSFRRRK